MEGVTTTTRFLEEPKTTLPPTTTIQAPTTTGTTTTAPIQTSTTQQTTPQTPTSEGEEDSDGDGWTDDHENIEPCVHPLRPRYPAPVDSARYVAALAHGSGGMALV